MIHVLTVLVLFWQVSSSIVSCSHPTYKDENKVLEVLLKDALLKHLMALQLKRSIYNEVSADFSEQNYEQTTTMQPDINNINDNHLLVMTFALSLEDFLVKEGDFLHDIEAHMRYKKVKCRVADASEPSLSKVLVDLYCFYAYSKLTTPHPVIFVPIHKLERLMTSGNMRGFLQKYNVTSFDGKEQKKDELEKEETTSFSVVHKVWFPISIGVGSFFVVIFVIMLYCVCCRKKKVHEGEFVDEEKPTHPDIISRHSSLCISPIKKRNSFHKSPKKFAYSPQKNSTPIFSFTSPSKYKDKVIYKVKSPIATTPPSLVQPQLELLFPMGGNTGSLVRTSSVRSSRSSVGSSLDRSSKTLLQSRRGSSASLVIDLSPKSPVKEFSPISDSPTEEILLHKSRKLRYKQLQKAMQNDKELHEEYWNIPPNTVSRRESNMRFSLKNRYPDILPNSKTIVRLKGEDQSHIYVNANYIRNKCFCAYHLGILKDTYPEGYSGVPDTYIATQGTFHSEKVSVCILCMDKDTYFFVEQHGPLACTLEDFWLMIWQCNCSIIVMITKLKERNKDKCAQYWPSSDTVTQQTYGQVVVTYDSELERDGYKIITFYVSHKNSDECRKVTHFWFTGWPDHKVPKECSQVLSLVKHIRQLQFTQSGPVVIHCSAGRGRTGCFIAISLGMFEIDEENKVDILKIVSRMRMDRGGMVDKDHQYKFVYKTLYEYWSNKRRTLTISPAMKRRPDLLSNPTSPISLASVELAEELRESDGSINGFLEDEEPVAKNFNGFLFNENNNK